MKTNISLSLDKRRQKKDGSFPIILRIGHYRKTTSISTGYSVNEKYWDKKNRRIRNSYKGFISVSRFNNYLSKEKSKALDIVNKLAESKELETLSITDVKNRLLPKVSSHSFFAFGEKLISDLNESKKFGNALTYKGALQILAKFVKGKDLQFREVNYNLLKRFEKHHLAKGNNLNSLSVYLRTIRAIYNKAIDAGLVEKSSYPFDRYKIKSEPTKKRAIDKENLRKIIDLKLEPSEPLFHTRNYFVLSYMLYGISFMDLAFLKLENIKAGRLTYTRKKTAKIYNIKITDQIKEILDYYTKGKKKADFIFSIIHRETLQQQHKEVLEARSRYNKKLKILAEKCSVEEHLTSYVARHSFATQALMIDVPVMAISDMLGHSNLKTTQVYLKSLPTDALDDFQQRIIEL